MIRVGVQKKKYDLEWFKTFVKDKLYDGLVFLTLAPPRQPAPQPPEPGYLPEFKQKISKLRKIHRMKPAAFVIYVKPKTTSKRT